DWKSEVFNQFSGCIKLRDSKESGSKIYHISFGSTGKTEIVLIDLHTWMAIIMKRTTCHFVPVNLDSILFCRLTSRNKCLNFLKYVHVYPPPLKFSIVFRRSLCYTLFARQSISLTLRNLVLAKLCKGFFFSYITEIPCFFPDFSIRAVIAELIRVFHLHCNAKFKNSLTDPEPDIMRILADCLCNFLNRNISSRKG